MINGIAYFVPEEERGYNVEYVRFIAAENWIAKNWNAHFQNRNVNTRNAAERIAAADGIILEIGAGPGGGFMPYVLDEAPRADIIVSDLCPTVLKEWKKFFDNAAPYGNLNFAALDTCGLPFNDKTLQVVSGNGGFGNIEGDKRTALREIYRVLKHGGMYVSGDICIPQEFAQTIPEHARKVLYEKFPDIFVDFHRESADVGFTKIETVWGDSWSNENDDSDLASLCRQTKNAACVFNVRSLLP
jgi:ubiquinone/menaquinone biosynthesis C-methylase UbiE